MRNMADIDNERAILNNDEHDNDHNDHNDNNNNNNRNHLNYNILYGVTLSLMVASIFCGIVVYAFDLLNNTKDTTVHDITDDDCTTKIDCYEKARAWLKFSHLLSTVAFATFCHSQLMFNTANNNINIHWNSNNKTFLIVFGTLYLGCILLQNWALLTCGKPSTFYIEIFQITIKYFLNILVVFNGKYRDHHHLHLETLYLFSIILFCEFIQTTFTDNHFHGHAVYTYYNIKLALVIYEIYIDRAWTTIFDDFDAENICVFIVFLGSKLMVQFYYTHPYEYRKSAEFLFWGFYIVGGFILQPLSLLYMLRKLI